MVLDQGARPLTPTPTNYKSPGLFAMFHHCHYNSGDRWRRSQIWRCSPSDVNGATRCLANWLAIAATTILLIRRRRRLLLSQLLVLISIRQQRLLCVCLCVCVCLFVSVFDALLGLIY